MFLSLARNEQVEFDLGWHVVRNLDSGVSDGTQNRDTVETQFFAESNFRSLSATTLGIGHLRQRLSMVLFGQIKAELPQLIGDIESGISSCHQGLEKLGPARITFEDQKAFLVDLSDDFQKLCEAAIKGDYEHDFFADRSLSNRRLSAMIANMGMDFAEDMRTKGAQWKIVEQANSRYRCRTRKQAIEDVRQLLRTSRGREVGIPILDTYPWIHALTICLHSYQVSQTLCWWVKPSASIASLGKDWHANTLKVSGTLPKVSWSKHCSI